MQIHVPSIIHKLNKVQKAVKHICIQTNTIVSGITFNSREGISAMISHMEKNIKAKKKKKKKKNRKNINNGHFMM